jgi:hypothetical protein
MADTTLPKNSQEQLFLLAWRVQSLFRSEFEAKSLELFAFFLIVQYRR